MSDYDVVWKDKVCKGLTDTFHFNFKSDIEESNWGKDNL